MSNLSENNIGEYKNSKRRMELQLSAANVTKYWEANTWLTLKLLI